MRDVCATRVNLNRSGKFRNSSGVYRGGVALVGAGMRVVASVFVAVPGMRTPNLVLLPPVPLLAASLTLVVWYVPSRQSLVRGIRCKRS